ncbi:hypothetical protein RCH17_002907 [Arthrobacter sp. MP_M7]|nr:hypothetical protein [Arthrobacter sp. MP_M4]MEC5204088.1 hypothetical protein [Arthrobacter sp. MP_M7]
MRKSNRMSYGPKARLKVPRIPVALFCVAAFLSACTPTTTENPMTGSNNPSDPATVKAQVEELKEALADLHAFKTETQKVIGPQKWADTDNPVNGACITSDGQDGVNYSILSQTSDPVDLEASINVVKTFWESKASPPAPKATPGTQASSASTLTRTADTFCPTTQTSKAPAWRWTASAWPETKPQSTRSCIPKFTGSLPTPAPLRLQNRAVTARSL